MNRNVIIFTAIFTGLMHQVSYGIDMALARGLERAKINGYVAVVTQDGTEYVTLSSDVAGSHSNNQGLCLAFMMGGAYCAGTAMANKNYAAVVGALIGVGICARIFLSIDRTEYEKKLDAIQHMNDYSVETQKNYHLQQNYANGLSSRR